MNIESIIKTITVTLLTLKDNGGEEMVRFETGCTITYSLLFQKSLTISPRWAPGTGKSRLITDSLQIWSCIISSVIIPTFVATCD